MKTELYNKYYDVLVHVNNVMNITSNENLKEMSKNTILNTVKRLCEMDKANKEMYEEMLVEFKLKENNLSEVEDISISEKNSEEENELVKEEVSSENKKPINEKSEDISGISNEISEQTSLDDINKEAEKYVFYNVYRNKDVSLGNKFQNIMRNLVSSLENKKIKEIENNINEYKKFIEDNKTIFDEEKMNVYLNYTISQYNNSLDNIETKNVDNSVSEEKKEITDKNVAKEESKEIIEIPKDVAEKSREENKSLIEGLKIKKIKKSFNSKWKNRTLSLVALASLPFAISNPLFTAALAVGGYSLYKRGVKEAKSLIEKNGLALNNEGNLIDVSGKIITKDDVGRLKYNLIKRELNKLDDKSGKIDKSYKKNKLTSMLLNAPIIRNIRNHYNKLKADEIEVSEEVNDMNKGMGIIK